LETVQDFLNSIYGSYDIFAYRGGRIIRGKLAAMTDESLAKVKRRLDEIDWLYSIEDIDGVDYLNCTVVEKPAARRRGLHLMLFAATVITTLIAGGDFGFAQFYGIMSSVVFSLINALQTLLFGGASTAAPTAWEWLLNSWFHFGRIPGLMKDGIPFSFAVLTILFCHEMGHYVMARRNGMDVSLPFFIPVPFGFGTLGAVIRIRSPLMHRRTVLDVGAAGPLTGAVVAMIFFTIGIAGSKVLLNEPLHPGTIVFGESILTRVLTWLVHGSLPANAMLEMHPFTLAGWLGLLITAINLMPIGQLDGAHVAYGLFGRGQRRLAMAAFGMLVTFGAIGWMSSRGWLNLEHGTTYWPWLLFALFTRFLMRAEHPPVVQDDVRLNPFRKAIGLLCFAFLIVSFMPSPFMIM